MQWEYKILWFHEFNSDYGSLEQGLEMLGLEGWQLCGVFYEQFIFKKVIQESMPHYTFKIDWSESAPTDPKDSEDK